MHIPNTPINMIIIGIILFFFLGVVTVCGLTLFVLELISVIIFAVEVSSEDMDCEFIKLETEVPESIPDDGFDAVLV